MTFLEIRFFVISSASTTTSLTSSWPCVKWRTPSRVQIWCELLDLMSQDNIWQCRRLLRLRPAEKRFGSSQWFLSQKFKSENWFVCIPVWPFWKQTEFHHFTSWGSGITQSLGRIFRIKLIHHIQTCLNHTPFQEDKESHKPVTIAYHTHSKLHKELCHDIAICSPCYKKHHRHDSGKSCFMFTEVRLWRSVSVLVERSFSLCEKRTS